MKKLLFVSAIIMAMFFTASCSKCDSCATPPTQQQGPPAPTQQVVGYDPFYGEVHDCPSTTGNIVEVRGANCNLLGKFPTEKPSLMFTLNGWNYRDCGPCPVMVASDIVAMVDYRGQIVSAPVNLNNYRVVMVAGSSSLNKKSSDSTELIITFGGVRLSLINDSCHISDIIRFNIKDFNLCRNKDFKSNFKSDWKMVQSQKN